MLQISATMRINLPQAARVKSIIFGLTITIHIKPGFKCNHKPIFLPSPKKNIPHSISHFADIGAIYMVQARMQSFSTLGGLDFTCQTPIQNISTKAIVSSHSRSNCRSHSNFLCFYTVYSFFVLCIHINENMHNKFGVNIWE